MIKKQIQYTHASSYNLTYSISLIFLFYFCIFTMSHQFLYLEIISI